ncbi:hypothetical protein KJY73_16955 [Bowmanella sp. Y26]|uniref:hypothetical protein n=1 Tax=Bowmanella yangjiangensis TaxID=2811230 RepID=UPI001BDCA3C0|nr:hypothetical protein [Bowmanella yangjiangensis]MBT1065283.1 hypothetical protein [Bowmanella yangjiangensis]
MKAYSTLLLPLCLLAAAPGQAAMIGNGDFQSCDFSHWQQDTDGLGSPSAGQDFTIENQAGNCRALLSVDDGQSTQAFFANTLYQELDLQVQTGEQLWLSFDWHFFGNDGDPQLGDYFNVGLNDGLGNLYGADGLSGVLLQSSTYAAGTFSIMLDNSFYNQTGWFLDFTLQEGAVIGDGLFSTLAIDNVQLNTFVSSINEPGLPLLMLAGAAALCVRRRRAQ